MKIFLRNKKKCKKKIQKQQELNDKDCRELTDEELDQIVGGAPRGLQLIQGAVVTLLDAKVATATVAVATQAALKDQY